VDDNPNGPNDISAEAPVDQTSVSLFIKLWVSYNM